VREPAKWRGFFLGLFRQLLSLARSIVSWRCVFMFRRFAIRRFLAFLVAVMKLG
jgi:hypothetical protein